MVGRPGLEPGTPALKVRCCYRLSYRPIIKNQNEPKYTQLYNFGKSIPPIFLFVRTLICSVYRPRR